jgi:hypothetical protein
MQKKDSAARAIAHRWAARWGSVHKEDAIRRVGSQVPHESGT